MMRRLQFLQQAFERSAPGVGPATRGRGLLRGFKQGNERTLGLRGAQAANQQQRQQLQRRCKKGHRWEF
jgi:hypothetical protein